jgi:hypothetical protein
MEVGSRGGGCQADGGNRADDEEVVRVGGNGTSDISEENAFSVSIFVGWRCALSIYGGVLRCTSGHATAR